MTTSRSSRPVKGRREAESPPTFVTPSLLEPAPPPSSRPASAASSSADALARVSAFFRAEEESALAPA
jgi:hypothetical protein